ncbi:MAG: ABC transporter permease [Holophagales bacterium]|nr:ABC transporter permease [Holophagales bacterium]
MHLPLLLADVLATYPVAHQDRQRPLAPPTPLRFFDAEGRFHARPFVYLQTEDPTRLGHYLEDRSQRFPLRFFAPGPWGKRLLGVDEPAALHLLGTDRLGRDVFSRLLHGARLSVLAGMLAATLAVALGTALGLVAGFYGGWWDRGATALLELFVSLPWLYLLIAVRAFLPLELDPMKANAVLAVLVGLLAWTRPARLVRGEALVARNLDPLIAARGFGASDLHLLRHHVLPHSYPTITTQWALLVPACVMAEITLSFLGLGASEPIPSLGTLLAPLASYSASTARWHMFSPAFLLAALVLSYHLMANAFRKRLGVDSVFGLSSAEGEIHG